MSTTGQDGSGSGGGGTARRKAARGASGSAASAKSGSRPSGGGRTTTKATPAPAPSTSGGSASRAAASTRRALDPDALAALEEERDFLLRSLDDLEREHDAGDVDDDDYAELKDDYTARAAAVLRAIEERRELATATAGDRSWARTASILGIVAVLALGVGWFVFRDSGTRTPGEGLSGDIRQDSANLVLQAQQFTGQATQALQEGDTEAALSNFEQAIKAYDEALELSPGNVEAMTYRGWVLHTIAVNSAASAGAELDAQAIVWLDRAISTDPTYPDARVFRAILRRNAGDLTGAQSDLAAVDTDRIPTFMQNMVESVRAEVEAGLAGATTTTAP